MNASGTAGGALMVLRRANSGWSKATSGPPLATIACCKLLNGRYGKSTGSHGIPAGGQIVLETGSIYNNITRANLTSLRIIMSRDQQWRKKKRKEKERGRRNWGFTLILMTNSSSNLTKRWTSGYKFFCHLWQMVSCTSKFSLIKIAKFYGQW